MDLIVLTINIKYGVLKAAYMSFLKSVRLIYLQIVLIKTKPHRMGISACSNHL